MLIRGFAFWRMDRRLSTRAMLSIRSRGSQFGCIGVLAVLFAGGGCRSCPAPDATGVFAPMPRELSKTVLPRYTIEPPDILRIEAVHAVPRPPYRLRTRDALNIQAWGTLPDAPIQGVYPVEPGGVVNLGIRYGSVPVGGMTVDEARRAIEAHLRHYLKDFFVSVTLEQMAAMQQIAGEHLVGPDGTVTLGSYGSVSVVGQSIAGAKAAIEAHLSQYLENPEISVDVFAYNSKVYYIVTQGAGLGDGVFRFPVTGNETVLDAISQINGLEQVSSKRIWIARPTDVPGNVQVLPVSWNAITACGSAASNYQILPGDRVFIAEDKLVAMDTHIGKITAPFERIMGFMLLGTGTVTRHSGAVLRGGGNARGTF
ncbi:MAG: hypothetical protein A2V70_06815 [Planctomycetes bacterium RBG_13_63_9]|nr:MAG: hypothetical protein A2V70_06815 [Planctomycetes bacterium RBG_13_63_9]